MNFRKLTSKGSSAKDLLRGPVSLDHPQKPLMSVFENKFRKFSFQNYTVLERIRHQQRLNQAIDQTTVSSEQVVQELLREQNQKKAEMMGEGRSNLSQISEKDQQLQDFVDQVHAPNQFRGFSSFNLGDMQKANFLGKWFRREDGNNDLENKQDHKDKEDLELKDRKEKEGEVDEQDEDDDDDFDEWVGVRRPGEKTTTDEEQDEDDNDGPDGGEMMPIPDYAPI